MNPIIQNLKLRHKIFERKRRRSESFKIVHSEIKRKKEKEPSQPISVLSSDSQEKEKVR